MTTTTNTLIPRCEVDEGWDEETARGFEAFWSASSVDTPINRGGFEFVQGWSWASSRAYGMGVKASMQATGDANPFPWNSAAWDAWACGFTEEPDLSGTA